MNKGTVLRKLSKLGNAIGEYDKGIRILERQVNVEQKAHLANELAMAYL